MPIVPEPATNTFLISLISRLPAKKEGIKPSFYVFVYALYFALFFTFSLFIALAILAFAII